MIFRLILSVFISLAVAIKEQKPKSVLSSVPFNEVIDAALYNPNKLLALAGEPQQEGSQ